MFHFSILIFDLKSVRSDPRGSKMVEMITSCRGRKIYLHHCMCLGRDKTYFHFIKAKFINLGITPYICTFIRLQTKMPLHIYVNIFVHNQLIITLFLTMSLNILNIYIYKTKHKYTMALFLNMQFS